MTDNNLHKVHLPQTACGDRARVYGRGGRLWSCCYLLFVCLLLSLDIAETRDPLFYAVFIHLKLGGIHVFDQMAVSVSYHYIDDYLAAGRSDDPRLRWHLCCGWAEWVHPKQHGKRS